MNRSERLSRAFSGIAALVLGLALAGCDQTVTVCTYWPDRRPIGELTGPWEFRDPVDGCRYISGSVHGSYTRAGGECWGPQRCETYPDQAAYEAAKLAGRAR